MPVTDIVAATARPLQDLRVIELASEPGTRYCGRLFSVLGAEVISVVTAQAARDTAFDHWIDERKTQAADFDAALAALRARNAMPDIVIAGQMPDAIAAADDLIAQRSLDVLRLGLTWFGCDGPYARWKGDDALIQALIGIAASFGAADGPPMLPQGRGLQFVGGATLFIAGLAALWGRARVRKHRTVDVNVLEAALCFTEMVPMAWEQTPVEPVRRGVNRFAANHPMTVYRTKDGWLGVTALTPSQWASLAEFAGHPEWADDPRFNSSLQRVANAAALDELLNGVLVNETTDYWLGEGQRRRIPLAPVPTHRQLLETEQWRLRESFAPIPGREAVKGPFLPFRFAFENKPVAPAGGPSTGAPLSGLRVIDFTMGWAGPLAARHLGDLGADVVKVESKTHYDWWRGWEPLADADPPLHEMSPAFVVMNRNKRGISLDLTTPEGRDRAFALVKDADIVIENYAPGVMEKLGLGYETLRALRPGLVVVAMGAFGATGPWRAFRAYGSTVEHASGMPHANGLAEWPPCTQHIAYGDPVAGIYGALGAMAALSGRARLGGAFVDLAQVECLFQLGADKIIGAQELGPPPRLGSRSPELAPRCVVPTADGFVAVVVTNGTSWRALCTVLERDDWARDESLATPKGRNARGDEIEAPITTFTRARRADEAATLLQAAGIPAAPVLHAHALHKDPHLSATGVWVRIERRHVGRHVLLAPPYKIDGERPPILRPSPLLGEHTDEVLAVIEGGP